jgi:hypothetical protein
MSPTWADIVVAITAIAALLLSVLGLFLRWRDGRVNLLVRASLALGLYRNREPGVYCVSISIANRGQQAAKVTYLGLEVRNNDNRMALVAPMTDKPLPCLLTPGDSADYMNPVEGLREGLSEAQIPEPWEVRAVVRDAFGHEHRSERWLRIKADK